MAHYDDPYVYSTFVSRKPFLTTISYTLEYHTLLTHITAVLDCFHDDHVCPSHKRNLFLLWILNNQATSVLTSLRLWTRCHCCALPRTCCHHNNKSTQPHFTSSVHYQISRRLITFSFGYSGFRPKTLMLTGNSKLSLSGRETVDDCLSKALRGLVMDLLTRPRCAPPFTWLMDVSTSRRK